MRHTSLFLLAAGATTIASCVPRAFNNRAMVADSTLSSLEITIGANDTFLKINKEDSSKLELNTQKCVLTLGKKVTLLEPANEDGFHLFVKMKEKLDGCQFSEGYLYSGDVVHDIPAVATQERSDGPSGKRRICKTDGDGVNLRAEPNTNSSVIASLVDDTVITLAGRVSGNFVYASLENSDQKGWVKTEFVCNVIPGGQYSSNLAASFRTSVIAGTHGRTNGTGKCYEYVWGALRDVIGGQIESLPVPKPSAYQFGDWVDANPESARTHLKVVRSKTTRWNAPVGSIFVWNPGQGGYSYTHGHIEIKIDSNTACSDGCWPINGSGPEPRIYTPVQ